MGRLAAVATMTRRQPCVSLPALAGAASGSSDNLHCHADTASQFLRNGVGKVAKCRSACRYCCCCCCCCRWIRIRKSASADVPSGRRGGDRRSVVHVEAFNRPTTADFEPLEIERAGNTRAPSPAPAGASRRKLTVEPHRPIGLQRKGLRGSSPQVRPVSPTRTSQPKRDDRPLEDSGDNRHPVQASGLPSRHQPTRYRESLDAAVMLPKRRRSNHPGNSQAHGPVSRMNSEERPVASSPGPPQEQALHLMTPCSVNLSGPKQRGCPAHMVCVGLNTSDV